MALPHALVARKRPARGLASMFLAGSTAARRWRAALRAFEAAVFSLCFALRNYPDELPALLRGHRQAHVGKATWWEAATRQPKAPRVALLWARRCVEIPSRAE